MTTSNTMRLAGLCVAITAAWQVGRAEASSCKFSGGLATYGAKGNSAALIAAGHVDVSTPAVYKTAFTVDVGVWVDTDLAALDPNIPSLALAYFEHATCIFAMGSNATTKSGIHDMSLRIAGNQIRYFKPVSPKVSGTNAYWVQRTHQDWLKAIKALGAAAPKINLLFTASNYVEIGSLGPDGKVATWTPMGGASNGVGQGQALARVDPAAYKNGAKAFNEDWWGVIAAHELGHALGFGDHRAVKFDNMCCASPVSYSTEPGNTASSQFSMSQPSWSEITSNNARTTDNYPDPYATNPNPVTNETWSFPQVHGFLIPYNFNDAVIWRHTGVPCSSGACPGWQALDDNTSTVSVSASEDRLYQLHNDGSIWRYTGTPCSGISCPGWQMLDRNPSAKAIVAGGTELYQLHSDGSIWRYTGTPCSGISCPGWQMLDHNAKTMIIVATGASLYQLHGDGAIWRYTGTPCSNAACPGWQMLDHNASTKVIAADGGNLYQLHGDGAIWRYTGTPCSSTACPGWQELDNNPKAKAIVAAGTNLYQLHGDGTIWRYTGTPCSSTGCPGWQELDNNAATVSLAASGSSLFQLHNDGTIWRYTGAPCSSSGCPGWQMLDHNAKTKAIVAGTSLYQVHAP